MDKLGGFFFGSVAARFGIILSLRLLPTADLLAGDRAPGDKSRPPYTKDGACNDLMRRKDIALKLQQAVKTRDCLRNKVKEWGVVTISSPVAILDDTSFFVPPDIVAPEDLFTAARTDVNANSIQLNEIGFSNETNLNLSPLPTVVSSSTKTQTVVTPSATPAPASSTAAAPAATPTPLLTDITNPFGSLPAPFSLMTSTSAPARPSPGK